jgi:hypothetical protein
MSYQFSRLMRVATAVCASAFVSTPASAQQSWSAYLSGLNEAPPNASPATGYAFVSLTGSLLSIHIEFSGLLGPTTASHLHCCVGAGVNAPVAIMAPSLIGFPLGVTSGTFDNFFDLNNSLTYSSGFLSANGNSVLAAKASFLAALDAGNVYANVHTQVFPGGEIRGNLVAVPEPTTVLLLTGGLLAVFVMARRRRYD